MDIQTGVLFAFAAMICWGVGDFLIQRTVRKIGIVEGLAVIGIVGTVGLLPFVWNDLQIIFQPENASLLLGLGVVTFIAAMFNLYAYKIGKLSVVEFVLEIELPVTVILGIVFFPRNAFD
ncbi:MAG: EamA family transporter [archaeon]